MIKKIKIALYFIAILWGVHLINVSLLDLNQFGIRPRNLEGLWGIIFSPFLHGNFIHLISNSGPLYILVLVLLVFYQRIAFRVIFFSTILGGGLLWAFGRSEMNGNPLVHIGASGLIYSLIAFLILSGFLQKNVKAILIAIVIFFMYGGVVWGIFPGKPWVSWDGHLFGAIGGILVAYWFRKKR